MQTLLRLLLVSLSISLFYGCSGHTLQDLIDGKTADKPSSKEVSNGEVEAKPVAPSQNKALNSISPSSTSKAKHTKDRALQKSTDSWLKNDWEPLTDGNTSTDQESNCSLEETNSSLKAAPTQNRSSKDINSTGLQYYVDKAGIYMENKEKRDANKTKAPSHTEKINEMPGIGKSKDRR